MPPAPAELTADEKAKIDQALPTKASVKPKRPRKMLILNANVRDDGRRPTIDPAMIGTNYALIEMGKRTGAYDARVLDRCRVSSQGGQPEAV